VRHSDAYCKLNYNITQQYASEPPTPPLSFAPPPAPRYRPPVPPTIRPITSDELVAWFTASSTAFYIWPNDPAAMAESRRETLEIDRALGAFEDGTIVGTFRSFSTRLTVPGGNRIPVNAISAVTVRPTHRRRGILRQMIAEDMRRAVARGDVASILIAAEWPIYGRFGFGPATWQARWTLRTRATTFDIAPTGRVEVVDRLAARQVLPAIYGAYAAGQPGEIERPEHRWDHELGLVESPGRPRWNGQVAIHRNDAGDPDAYVRFHGEEHWDDMAPDHRLIIDELHGATLEAEIDLWRHLAQMDLTAMVEGEVRREHEPMKWHLADGRAARVTSVTDFLWLRVLDVERALGERTYERDGTFVLEVIDDVDGAPGPAAGRYRLEVRDGAGTCTRSDAAPELTLDVRDLSAALLGGTRVADAFRAGRGTEHRPGALADTDRLLRTADEPWCTTWF
jgi:predicted acetyltransferase